MEFSVSHGIVYHRSKHWYAFVGTLLLIIFVSLLIENNFIGIVLFIVFLASYVFYAFVLVPQATTLIITKDYLQWNTTLYNWELFESFWVEIPHDTNIKYIYFQKSGNKELLSMNFYDDIDKLESCIKQLLGHLPFQQPHFSFLEKVMRFLKL